jgi:hypothetical protein
VIVGSGDVQREAGVEPGVGDRGLPKAYVQAQSGRRARNLT